MRIKIRIRQIRRVRRIRQIRRVRRVCCIRRIRVLKIAIKKCQFQFLVTFLLFFFWSVNCKNLVCISSLILNMGNVLFEDL